MTAASGADRTKKARVCGDCELGNHETCAVESPTFYCPCAHASGADACAVARRQLLGDALVDDWHSPVAGAARSAFRLGWNAALEHARDNDKASDEPALHDQRLAVFLDGHVLDPWLMKCSCGAHCGRPGTPRHAAHLVDALLPLIEADRERAKAEGGAEALEKAAARVPRWSPEVIAKWLRERAAALRGSTGGGT